MLMNESKECYNQQTETVNNLDTTDGLYSPWPSREFRLRGKCNILAAIKVMAGT